MGIQHQSCHLPVIDAHDPPLSLFFGHGSGQSGLFLKHSGADRPDKSPGLTHSSAFSWSLLSCMSHHLKTLQLYMGFPHRNPRLSFGNPNLFFHRIHAFQIGKQKPSFQSLTDNHAVTLHIQLFG